ncbi:MAG: hypothetical protein HGA71_15915 [Azonexaceae bacterium]|nr:hypothetical protein [Azonexaceae bacterium]
MDELIINAVYAIELCGGEVRYWQYLGPDSRRLIWWLDTETKQEFNEAGLMYAWSIKGLHSSRGQPA